MRVCISPGRRKNISSHCTLASSSAIYAYIQNHGTRMPLQEVDGEDEMEVEEEENQTSSEEA